MNVSVAGRYRAKISRKGKGTTLPSSEQKAEDPFQIESGTVVLGGEAVLRNVSLSIPNGQFLALLGANGSGKSTLLRTFLGLQSLADGEVRIFGTPVDSFRQWRRIGYVPQDLMASTAVPVSVAEIVQVSAGGSRLGWRRSTPDRTQEILQRVGLWNKRKDSFHSLSGGQQRRAMIAAALAKNADVLLLDEPTAGLDRENMFLLADILAEYKSAGRTIIVVAHELGVLEPLIDRCIAMGQASEGSIAYDGSPPLPSRFHDPHGHHESRSPRDNTWGAD